MFCTGLTCRVRNFCLEIDNKLFLRTVQEDRKMSKKTTIICSCILFVLLVALMACQVMNPTGGQAFLSKIF